MKHWKVLEKRQSLGPEKDREKGQKNPQCEREPSHQYWKKLLTKTWRRLWRRRGTRYNIRNLERRSPSNIHRRISAQSLYKGVWIRRRSAKFLYRMWKFCKICKGRYRNRWRRSWKYASGCWESQLDFRIIPTATFYQSEKLFRPSWRMKNILSRGWKIFSKIYKKI